MAARIQRGSTQKSNRRHDPGCLCPTSGKHRYHQPGTLNPTATQGGGTSGDALSEVPRHGGSVWSTYAFSSLPGLKIGVGVYYVGAREATLPNTFQLSTYARADAMVSYARGHWSAQLNLLNVFDRRYYIGGSAGVFNYTLTSSVPATAQLTLSYRFAC
ncbi:TonB-dependent receptor domain-containing protein [Xanthomonas arboricola]